MAEAARPERRGTYDFAAIEARWQAHWAEHNTFAVANPGEPRFAPDKRKCYVLDMFPYPSGQGLHVGHPLGYCATDIYSRYKRMKGFNVLHPIGFDAFGLPAEQYAIESGVHPAITTRRNIGTYRRQLKMLGLSYDWAREIATCEPEYYRATQWIFLQLFNSWYDERAPRTETNDRKAIGRTRPIAELERELAAGTMGVNDALDLVRDPERAPHRKWSELSDEQKRTVIDGRRIAYLDEVPVNWCPALGTVLANEEVTADGLSDRGDHPVFRRPLRQWMLRITAYAERLLADLDTVDWPEPIKIMQRNWIGRSTGAEVDFPIYSGGPDAPTVGGEQQWRVRRAQDGYPARTEDFIIRVYTTRPDTLFGATYMVLAPEHPLVEHITTDAQRDTVRAYVEGARHRSDLERTAGAKEKTGVFTGAYAINPVNGEKVPVWVADYVLMGYGTGAIMAVPAGDTRDFEFAKVFDLPIVTVVLPAQEWFQDQIRRAGLDADYCRRRGKADLPEQMMNSASASAGTLGGITAQDATAIVDGDPGWVRQVALPAYATDAGIFREAFTGEGTAINSPPGGKGIKGGCTLNDLPSAEATRVIVGWLERTGLGRGAVNYKLRDWIFSRQKYWGEPFPVLHGEDGTTVALDEGELPLELPDMQDFKPVPSHADDDTLPEPPLGRAEAWLLVDRDGKRYRRDTNTMPQWAGSCWYYLRYISPHDHTGVCDPQAERYWMPVDLYVGGAEHAVLHLLYARFWHKVLFDLGHVSTPEPFGKLVNQGMIQAFAYKDRRGALVGSDRVAEGKDGAFRTRDTDEPVTQIVAKMSKALKNVVSPDDVVAQYGADAFRMYEMYMGPIEAGKPWNTRDVPGLFKLLNRIWRLVVDEQTGALSAALVDEEPDECLARMLHKTIRKVGADIEQLKFNTAIGQMFEFVNELTPRAKKPRRVVETFVLVLAPFAPHIAEELWHRLGHPESLAYEPWPAHDEQLADDERVEVAVQINGKVRVRLMVAADTDEEQLRAAAMEDERIAVALRGKSVRKVIAVKGRLVNIVAS